MDNEIKFYLKKELLDRLPFSPTTLWRQCKRGNFPSPVKISPGRVGWEAEAADAAIAALAGVTETVEDVGAANA